MLLKMLETIKDGSRGKEKSIQLPRPGSTVAIFGRSTRSNRHEPACIAMRSIAGRFRIQNFKIFLNLFPNIFGHLGFKDQLLNPFGSMLNTPHFFRINSSENGINFNIEIRFIEKMLEGRG